MIATDFVRTIYLGDRGCKSVTVDGWNSRVLIEVDEISRVRSESGNWEYYNDENIVDGLLVFTEVRSVCFDPSGPMPNDYISGLDAKLLPDGYYLFEFSAGAGDEQGNYKEVSVTIEAKSLHLEDPANPGVVIDT